MNLPGHHSEAAPTNAIVESAPSLPRGVRRALLRRHNEHVIAARALVRVRRMPLWKSSLIAVGGLVLVGGVAIGEMAGIGQLLHIANPARHFDVFHALHNQLVVGSLIGVALLWLLPPHPWAKQVIEADPSDVDATPEVHAGWRTPGNVVALASYQGRAPPRPPDAKGVGG